MGWGGAQLAQQRSGADPVQPRPAADVPPWPCGRTRSAACGAALRRGHRRRSLVHGRRDAAAAALLEELEAAVGRLSMRHQTQSGFLFSLFVDFPRRFKSLFRVVSGLVQSPAGSPRGVLEQPSRVDRGPMARKADDAWPRYKRQTLFGHTAMAGRTPREGEWDSRRD